MKVMLLQDKSRDMTTTTMKKKLVANMKFGSIIAVLLLSLVTVVTILYMDHHYQFHHHHHPRAAAVERTLAAGARYIPRRAHFYGMGFPNTDLNIALNTDESTTTTTTTTATNNNNNNNNSDDESEKRIVSVGKVRRSRSPQRGNSTHIFRTPCKCYITPEGAKMYYRTVEVVRRRNTTLTDIDEEEPPPPPPRRYADWFAEDEGDDDYGDPSTSRGGRGRRREEEAMEVDDAGATGSYNSGRYSGGRGATAATIGNDDWRLQTPEYFNSVGVYNDEGYRLWYDGTSDRMYRYREGDTMGQGGGPVVEEVSRHDYNIPIGRALPAPQPQQPPPTTPLRRQQP